MPKLSYKEIHALAERLILENPGGIRFTDLCSAIYQQHPETPRNTVQSALSKFGSNPPPTVRKEGRGLYLPAAPPVEPHRTPSAWLSYLHLKGVGPAPEMELHLVPRLNLLTGDNGLGKTFLLDVAWWVLTRHWPAEVNPQLTSGRLARPADADAARIEFRNSELPEKRPPHAARFDLHLQAWKEISRRSDFVGLVLYAQADGSFAVWDPWRNMEPQYRTASRPESPAAYVFSPGEVWDGLRPGPRPICRGLIEDWASWQKERGVIFDHLTAILAALSPEPDEVLLPGELTRVSLDDVRDIPTLRMPYGQDVPVLEASSGMRRVMALAYLLVWTWEEHIRASKLLNQETARRIVFLVDEIEAHLHPRWQRTILRSLLSVMQELSKEVDVQVLVTTHSPLVMASVEPWFDETQDAWFDLDFTPGTNGKHGVRLEKREWERHGDASRWLTSEAFDLRDAGSLEREEALEQASHALSDEHFDRARARALHRRLQEVLGPTDPFWMRWRYVGEMRGWLP